MATEQTQADLERELEELLDQETFEPPDEFREAALLTDESVYEKASADPQAYWAEQAKSLPWFTEPKGVPDAPPPPFYKWFSDGKINASYNCLDRHVEDGLGDRVAFHWRGEEGEERDVTYADLLADVKRFANAMKDHGVSKGDVVGIYLPM